MFAGVIQCVESLTTGGNTPRAPRAWINDQKSLEYTNTKPWGILRANMLINNWYKLKLNSEHKFIHTSSLFANHTAAAILTCLFFLLQYCMHFDLIIHI